MRCLVIIPAYNEEENIVRVVENLQTNYPMYDYVVINDGSSDDTARICRKRGYELVDLPVNLGLAGAFQTGLKYAYRKGYDYAIQFDADGQHRAEYIGPMLEKIKEGYDIVIGSRFVTEKKPHSMRMIGSRLIAVATRLTTGKKVKDPTSGMRMFNKKMIAEFALNDRGIRPELKLWSGAGYDLLPAQAGGHHRGGPGADGRAHRRRELFECDEIHDVYAADAAFDLVYSEFPQAQGGEGSMSPIFRVILIVVSLLTTFYILKKIRQSKLQIEYAIFWILFAGVLIVFSLFPWLVSMFTRLIGMQLPVNFIFMFFIFVLLVKMFLMTIELSALENKVKDLTQELALEEKERADELKSQREAENGSAGDGCIHN